MSAAIQATRIGDAELAQHVASGGETLGITLATQQIDRLVTYVRLLQRWSVTYNLTAVRDPRDMVVLHILDCLAAAAALLRHRDSSRADRLLDVGSGAGLPGLVIATVAPAVEIVCVDSVGKKAAFITQAAGVLGLKNVRVLHCRVEAIVEGAFDVVASRAFAPLGNFVASTKHLLADGGTWMAMKGKVPKTELEALRELMFHVEPVAVPGLEAVRCVVWISRAISE